MSDEIDEEMIGALPATPVVDPLALLHSMLTMVTSARQCERRVRELRRETAAAEKAKAALADTQAEITAARTALEQFKAAELAKIQVQADRAQARMDAAEAKEDSFAERERRIHELEERWKFVDEDEDVRRGFREPENGTPLEKARRAYGVGPPIDGDDGRQETHPDPQFQDAMPPDVTLGHSLSRPVRSQRGAN